MHFKSVTKEALLQFIPTVRLCDAREVEIMSGMNYDTALIDEFDLYGDDPEYPMIMLHCDRNDVVYALGGYGSDGGVWFLTSDHVDDLSLEDKRNFLAHLKIMRTHALLFSKVGYIHNCVLKQNEMHIKLLTKLGADFGPSIQINGHEFLPFVIK